MAAAKTPARKHEIQASDVELGKRTLEAVLTDLAEVVKECAVRSARAEERSARAEEVAAEAATVAAEAAKRSVRAEEVAAEAAVGSQLALQTIGALLGDLRALAERTDARLGALEKTAAE
jgi:hypothetical protein